MELKKFFKDGKPKTGKISFKEVGLKFGDKVFGKKDVLASPCQDGKFYFAKDIIRPINGYQLEDGTNIRSFKCPRSDQHNPYKNLSYVELPWTVQGNHYINGRMSSADKITVGSCSFSWVNVGGDGKEDWRVKMECFQNFWQGRGAGAPVNGIFGKDNYKYD